MDCLGFYIWAKQTKDHAAMFDCVCDYVSQTQWNGCVYTCD